MKQIGKTSLQINPVIMGTWQAGKSMWVGIDDQEITQAIQKAYEVGINAFDTAPMYGDGYAETILGKSIKEFRHEIVIATKVAPQQLQYQQVKDSCHASLKRLQCDYIDLLQIHWPAGTFGSPVVPLEETLKAFQELKEEGKIRAIGVSNFSLAQLQEAQALVPIDSLQPPYSLFWRHIDAEIKPFCQEQEISILAYSPLAQGFLTGKFDLNHQFEKGDHRHRNKLFKPAIYPYVQEALDQLKILAADRKLTLTQLALAWITSQKNCCAIAGVRNAGQIIENASVNSLALTSDEVNQMTVISQIVTDHQDQNPMLWG